jgi:hypothetical protein
VDHACGVRIPGRQLEHDRDAGQEYPAGATGAEEHGGTGSDADGIGDDAGVSRRGGDALAAQAGQGQSAGSDAGMDHAQRQVDHHAELPDGRAAVVGHSRRLVVFPEARVSFGIISPMLKGLNVFAVIAMLTATVALASSTPPDFVYKLQASKRSSVATYLARTPDCAALVLIPQSGGQWNLIRLTGLGAPSLHEEKLDLSGFTKDQLESGDANVPPSIDVSPDGHYAVIRTQTWKAGLYTVQFDGATAQLAVIDLQSFKVVSTLNTTDPMYAGSSWAFSGDGMLITESNPASTAKPGQSQKAYSIAHKAAALVLPALQPSVTCNYTEVVGPFSPGAATHRDVSVSDLSGSCSELVKFADASSVQDIRHSDRTLRRVSEQLHFGAITMSKGNIHACQIKEVSIGEKFALYACDSTHLTWYDTYKDNSRSVSVLTVPDGREIISVPLEVKRSIASVLVTVSGQDYLLILTDGIDLAVYRLQP